MLTADEVLKIAEMARIELRPDEVEKFQQELSTVLDYVADLQKVDTESLDIVSSVTGLENVMREDKAVLENKQEKIMSNAPEIKDGYYKVKAIL